MPKPLSHFRIVDLSCVLAGPFSTQLLADFGAEVDAADLFDENRHAALVGGDGDLFDVGDGFHVAASADDQLGLV